MKKLLFIAASVLFLASCKNAPQTSNGNTTQDQVNGQHSLEVYKALETGDVSKLDSFIAKDFVDHSGADGVDLKGRDSIKLRIADLHTHFTGLKFDVLSQSTADNGYHFALVRMTGTTKDSLMGVPPGTKMQSTSVDVVKVKDGMATEHWSYIDQKRVVEMVKARETNEPADTTKM
jgi:predicted SnoaL-like aldol condensation-catalyzing enzyme